MDTLRRNTLKKKAQTIQNNSGKWKGRSKNWRRQNDRLRTSPGGPEVKHPSAQTRDTGSIPG